MQSEPTPSASSPSAGEQVPVYDRDGPRSGWRGRVLAGAAFVLIGVGAGFALGRATAPSGGPKTLAEAFQQAQQGKLPTGNLQGQPGQGGPFGGQGNQGAQGNQQGGNQQGGNRGPGAGAGVQGDITTVSGDVLTISTPAGDLKVKLGGSTTIQNAVSAAKGDLAVGDTVSVRLDPSASNSGDGTVTASSITEEPAQ
jgi:hypothetical protein